MVGPVTNASGNETCIEVDYRSLDEMHAFAGAYGRAHAGEMRALPMLSMVCVASRRDVFERVGLLDERFGIGMFEDDDYAWRVRALGYRCVCVEDVFVHHFGRSAFKGLDAASYDALFERNRRLFEDKWHTVWERHAVRR
jgi:GT2 family glycosyltransferase